ncbi:MAG: 50S ribosomal protein L23 [Planctomycetota bacterium]|nr:50S ribosomal protein L23 [Planctomycetota bacterium]
MDNTNVIIKPLVTEKSTHQQTSLNAYAFHVHQKANKRQIKQAVEQIYSVKVLEVRTMNRKGKPRRTRYKETKTSGWKRAVVVLDENSRIDLF